MARRILLFLGFTLLILPFACKKEKKKVEDKLTVPVSVIRVTRGVFVEYGDYYGSVRGIEEAELICTSGGFVEKIDVKEGSKVKAGQSLAKIDSRKAINQCETAELNQKIALDNYQRQLKFLKSGTASQVAVDRAHLAYLNSKTNFMNAERAKKGALCISPISGIVVAKYIDEFEELPPGSPTFVVADIEKLKITIGIPENDIPGIKEYNDAVITFNNYPDRTWKGRLVSFSRKTSPKLLTFQAEIHIDNPDGLILSGTTANVHLTRRILRNQIIIPTNTLLTIDDSTYVMGVRNNKVKRIPVKTGVSNTTHTVILSGLNTGENIIVEGVHLVSDASLVKIIK